MAMAISFYAPYYRSVSDKPFNDPHLALNRIYTKRGDKGETSLVGGQRVSKDAARIEAYGTVDELNSFVGLAVVSCEEMMSKHPRLESLLSILCRVQHELFNLGSILATLPEDVHPKQPRVTAEEVSQLEREIDEMNDSLPNLRSFVLPGGTRINAELHVTRTICRRAERLLITLARTESVPIETIQYLNRLSDAMFVWSRWVNVAVGAPEILWEPNQAASAKNLK
jgi:cob(I)alamin adenosyltransferase